MGLNLICFWLRQTQSLVHVKRLVQLSKKTGWHTFLTKVNDSFKPNRGWVVVDSQLLLYISQEEISSKSHGVRLFHNVLQMREVTFLWEPSVTQSSSTDKS